MKGPIKGQDDRQRPGRTEKVFMASSALLVLALFAYIVFHAVTTPAGMDVQVTVVGVEPTAAGVEVGVKVVNQASNGLRSVTVEVACSEPAPEVTLENLPAASERHAVLWCPQGTEDPEARVVSVIPV